MIQNLSNTTGTGLWCGQVKTYASPRFTVSAWIRRMGTGTTISMGAGGLAAVEPIFCGGMGESETIGLNVAWALAYIPPSGSIGGDFEDMTNGGNHFITASVNSILNNTMSHVALTYDYSSSLNTGSWKLYINGALNATALVTSATATTRTPDTSSTQGIGIGIGVTSAGARTGAFYGYITDVAYWSTILNATEIYQLYQSNQKYMPLQIQPSSLQVYYPLDDLGDNVGRPTSGVSASIIQDRSGRNRHGTPYLKVSGSAENFLSY